MSDLLHAHCPACEKPAVLFVRSFDSLVCRSCAEFDAAVKYLTDAFDAEEAT